MNEPKQEYGWAILRGNEASKQWVTKKPTDEHWFKHWHRVTNDGQFSNTEQYSISCDIHHFGSLKRSQNNWWHPYIPPPPMSGPVEKAYQEWLRNDSDSFTSYEKMWRAAVEWAWKNPKEAT